MFDLRHLKVFAISLLGGITTGRHYLWIKHASRVPYKLNIHSSLLPLHGLVQRIPAIAHRKAAYPSQFKHHRPPPVRREPKQLPPTTKALLRQISAFKAKLCTKPWTFPETAALG